MTGEAPGSLDSSRAGQISPAQLAARLGSSASGLSTDQAARRRAQFGPNSFRRERPTALRVLARQFNNPLVFFLAVAAALSFATADVSDGSIITAILLLNGVIGFSQEFRSERAVEKLRALISNHVTVERDGKPVTLDVVDLVPGDVVVLKEGDVVPADVKLLVAEDVVVDESQLTGESVGVSKAVPADASTAGDASLAFTGSTVRSGELTGLVYATGNDTALGKIATMSVGVHKVTRYQTWLRSFSTLLMRIVICSLAVTVAIKLLSGHGSTHVVALLVFVIALAVSVVPEALPVIATLTMARGALQLAKQDAVVKRLSSLEDLGDVNLLCTDKTGTLTDGRPSITGLVSSDDHLFEVLAWAAVDPTSGGRQGTQGAFDAAFARFVPDDAKQEAAQLRLVGEVPFDPADRRRRVLLSERDSGKRTLVVVGSPETLLDIAPAPDRQEYLGRITAEGRQGMRHLGLAYRHVQPGESSDVRSLEHDLSFLGCVTLSDPLRPGIAETIASSQALGVSVKILTGDSVDVAAYVARQVGLLDEHGVVYSGDDLARMSEAELQHAAGTSNVFARVSPEQKFALVKALERSAVVGYQGDGINDAPSLKLADVGIAVDSATDVAKSSADIILLDRSLAVIVNAIRFGRSIFANINKYIVYTMVGNFGNFLALNLLYLLATTLPLLPRQLLLVSLLTDVPLVAISTDSVDAETLARPSSYDARSLLSISSVLGTFTAAAELAFFVVVRHQALVVRETSLYLFLSLTQLVVIFAVRNKEHFWKATAPSQPLLLAMIMTGVVSFGITYLPDLAHLFSFRGPSWRVLGLLLTSSVLYFVLLDVVKVSYYRVVDRRRSTPHAHAAAVA